MKKTLVVVSTACIILFALTLDSTKSIINAVWGALKPVALGVFFALILKPMISFFEKTVFSGKKLEKYRRGLALVLSLVVGIGAIALICYLVVPEVVQSLKALKTGLEWLMNGGLNARLGLSEKVNEWLDIALKKVGEWVLAKTPLIIERIGEIGKGIVNCLLGLMLGISLLLGEEKIGEFFEKIGNKVCKKKEMHFIQGALKAAVAKFSSYLLGSIIEAIIFSTVSYLAFLIFKIPYALLIAVIVGIFNLIPTIGGYIGGALGALIILTVSMDKALLFIAIMLVLQQVEQVTTYPVVVGKYVGLNPFFVLLAVVIGGGLFGFWGLLLGVPTMAFIYNLLDVITSQQKKR